MASIAEIIYAFTELSDAVGAFHDTLYHQKHAFYFRELVEWREYLTVSSQSIL